MGDTKDTPRKRTLDRADSAPPGGVLRWFGDLFYRRSLEIIALTTLSAAGTLAIMMWGTIERHAHSYIVDIAIAELERDNGRFHGPIQKIFEGARQSEVGTLSAGEFVLTPTNRAYTVYVYYPEGYKGKLYYSLEGVSSPKSVTILLPNGDRGPIKKTESSIDLAKSIEPRRGTLSDQGIDGVFDSQTALGDIRAFTFQLTGEDADTPPTGEAGASDTEHRPLISRVEVRYVSFVAPAIHIDK
ncbi:MAG: hypothetical protein WD852_06740 [Methyloceanibacter sp.]